MQARRARHFSGAPAYASWIILAALALFILAYAYLPKYLKPDYPQMLYSLAFFLGASYLVGYSFTRGVFRCDDKVELVSMRMAFGLSSMPLLFVLMESAHVPLKWYVLLALSLVRPLYDLLMGGIKISAKLPAVNADLYSSAALLLAALAFALALYGSFVYPYLEDGDSWEHAAGVKYVSLYGTYTKPAGLYVAHYLKPYPPSYDVMLGLVNQLNTSVSWTLKTFNSVLLGLTYLFSFYFVRRITGSGKVALYSSAVLFMLPPFGSHAIWAHTLSALLIYPVFYAVENAKKSKSWAVLASVFMASSLIVQPIMSAVMVVFYLIYLLAAAYADRAAAKRLAIVAVAAVLMSLIFWVPNIVNPSGAGELGSVFSEILGGQTKVGVSQAELPTPLQVFFPKPHGDMFMPQGFGLFVMLLALLFLDRIMRKDPLRLLKDNPSLMAVTAWFIFSFIALFSGGLSVSFYPPRFWGITSISLAIISGHMLANLGELKWVPKKAKNYVLPVIILGLLATSAYPKAVTQISYWPNDLMYAVEASYIDYYSLVGLPANTMVYPLCVKDAYIIGFDKLSTPWDSQVVAARADPTKVDPAKLYSTLKSRGYEWMMVDYSCVKRCANEKNLSISFCRGEMDKSLANIEKSGLFIPTWHTNTTILKLK